MREYMYRMRFVGSLDGLSSCCMCEVKRLEVREWEGRLESSTATSSVCPPNRTVI